MFVKENNKDFRISYQVNEQSDPLDKFRRIRDNKNPNQDKIYEIQYKRRYKKR